MQLMKRANPKFLETGPMVYREPTTTPDSANIIPLANASESPFPTPASISTITGKEQELLFSSSVKNMETREGEVEDAESSDEEPPALSDTKDPTDAENASNESIERGY